MKQERRFRRGWTGFTFKREAIITLLALVLPLLAGVVLAVILPRIFLSLLR